MVSKEGRGGLIIMQKLAVWEIFWIMLLVTSILTGNLQKVCRYS